jgi:eukaryotic-like serine/threonine-protein kinase
MNLEVGSIVGDYQVIGILGAGGMGQVYKVRNTISDRVEAMKVLLPDLAQQPDLADRFLREIKVQASLEHPNIASLHTAVRVDNQLLMLMEFVEGVTLEEKAKNGPLPVAEAVEYIRQVLAALEYAHARGVVHRDIKPANMMLTPSGVVKLMDFGIAKAATDRRLTMTGTTMGSLYYMSPEQIQGADSVDARSDLYSVGVSLYELVTGKRPFDGDSQYAIMAAHLEKVPVPPIQIDPSLPPALNDIILISVLKDPNARFQTAAAFRNALGTVAVAVPAPTVTMTDNFHIIEPTNIAAPRSKRGLWMAIGAVAAVLAVVAVIEFGPRKGTNAAPQVVTQTAQPQPPPQAPAPASAPLQEPAQPAAAPVQETPQPQSAPARPARRETRAPVMAAQPSPQPVQQQPQPAPTPVQQAPAAPPPVATEARPPVRPLPAGPSRQQLQEAREQLMMLNTRATGIRGTLQSVSGGRNLNAALQEPATLMDQYLGGAGDALRANDLEAAKDFMQKAERQIEKLEKALNR